MPARVPSPEADGQGLSQQERRPMMDWNDERGAMMLGQMG